MKYTKLRKHIPPRFFFFALGLCAIVIAALANSPAPAQAALKPPTPSYSGALERADCGFITGLAYDANAPENTVSVDIYDGSNLVATVLANRFRRDLSDQGWENPFHGFLLSTPASLADGNIHSIYANFAGTGIGLSGSPKFIACNSSLFPTEAPQSLASAEGTTWEQGVEVSSSLNGVIRQVRFWRAAEEPAAGHTARIWSTSGTLLASAPFNETSTPGWQYATVNFPITTGVRYRVTFNLYQYGAKTFFVFNNGPITKGPLTAWTSWYGTPGGSFPTSNSTSNLFADVVFNSTQ